jgi:Methylase of chemotaxis methyl-accepting proteins
MNADTPPADRMSNRDFERLGAIIQAHCGIRMPPGKKTMVEGRLRRRVRALNLSSLNEYCRRLFEGDQLQAELAGLIDAMTTNKTDFFREIDHFQHLVDKGLPHLAGLPHRPGRDRPMKLWSAACSVGAEPYTLAMVLSDHARSNRDFRFEITATDICTDVLARAKQAIYPEEMIRPVPADMAKRYVRRSRERSKPTVRLVPEIRQCVRFGHLNLMATDYPVDTDMDVIFCRNILIYFDKETQQAVLRKLCRHLRPGGYLFVGHSETVAGLGLPLRQASTAAFIRS